MIIEKLKEIINNGFIFNETETVVGLAQINFISTHYRKKKYYTPQKRKYKKSSALDTCFSTKDFYKNLNYFDLNVV